jgi:hypothetical protein
MLAGVTDWIMVTASVNIRQRAVTEPSILQ